MDAIGEIHYDVTSVPPKDEIDGRQEEAIDETPYPSREQQKKMVVGTGDGLLTDGGGSFSDDAVVVICIPETNVWQGAFVQYDDWGPVLQDVEGTIEGLCRLPCRGIDGPDDRYRGSYGLHRDMLVGVSPPSQRMRSPTLKSRRRRETVRLYACL